MRATSGQGATTSIGVKTAEAVDKIVLKKLRYSFKTVHAVARKYHLDSVSGADGTTSFTLVFEDSQKFFVEERRNSHGSNVEQVIKNIPASDFGKHQVNGVSLIKLVATKLGEPQNFN